MEPVSYECRFVPQGFPTYFRLYIQMFRFPCLFHCNIFLGFSNLKFFQINNLKSEVNRYNSILLLTFKYTNHQSQNACLKYSFPAMFELSCSNKFEKLLQA